MKFMVLNQVTKSLCIQRITHQFRRYVQSESQALPRALYPLINRKLLHVSGQDAPVFLQGLITNDMRHFDEGAKSIYAMFLNTKGRVMYDTLIYKWNNSFLLECDASTIQTLQKHLKLYKLKRDVIIAPMEKDLKPWVLMTGKDPTPNEISSNDITLYKDPRITDLGYRVLAPQTMTGSELLDKIGTKDVKIESNEEGYKCFRYKLGVSEGSVDITPGSSFPLEANCDYLHGVSFHKGCYIGQEVTARIHHTGVVRKRLMPIQFTCKIKDTVDPDAAIYSSKDSKVSLGKLKSHSGIYGLALVRIKESLESQVLHIGKLTANVIKPTWWPKEAPKEKATATKSETDTETKLTD